MGKSKSVILHAKALPATNDTIILETAKPKLTDTVKRALMNGAWETCVPFFQAVDRREAVSGSLQFDKAYAAAAMKKYLVDDGDTGEVYPDFSEAAISRAITWSLKAMRDEEGNALDGISRKRRALEDMRSEK